MVLLWVMCIPTVHIIPEFHEVTVVCVPDKVAEYGRVTTCVSCFKESVLGEFTPGLWIFCNLTDLFCGQICGCFQGENILVSRGRDHKSVISHTSRASYHSSAIIRTLSTVA